MKRIAIGAVAIFLLLVGGVYLYLHQPQFRVDVPEYQNPPEKLIHAEQGWTEDQRLRFHHTPQGTRLVPYNWFMALEQPGLSLFGWDLFTDKTYLSRFGFLSSQADSKLNPGGLPIGFARLEKALFLVDHFVFLILIGLLTVGRADSGPLLGSRVATRVDGPQSC